MVGSAHFAKMSDPEVPEVHCRVCEQERETYHEEDVDSDALPPFQLSPDRGA